MNKEEKEAIEYLKARLYGNEGCYLIDVAQSDLRILLNLVENQQKGKKNWEKIYDEDQNYIGELNDKIFDLEFKIKKQQKRNKKLKRKCNQFYGTIVKIQKEGPFNVGFDEAIKCVRDKITSGKISSLEELLEDIEKFLRRVTNE